jgi:transcriptional regulator with XRE-family HTH domain
MDDQRVGAALRALRIRRGWTQRELAIRAAVSVGVVSLIERGHLLSVSPRALRRVAGALEVRIELALRLRHGELDRLVNAGHSALHEAIARHLASTGGWEQAAEVSFAFYAERGIIDILAFHRATATLLVIELKTELVSLEDLLATMDVRVRHAPRIGRDRGWQASSVGAWVVFADTATNRRRVRAHGTVLRTAFPADGRRMRSWLSAPDGPLRALSFWTNFNGTTVIQQATACRRVRKRATRRRVGLIAGQAAVRSG